MKRKDWIREAMIVAYFFITLTLVCVMTIWGRRQLHPEAEATFQDYERMSDESGKVYWDTLRFDNFSCTTTWEDAESYCIIEKQDGKYRYSRTTYKDEVPIYFYAAYLSAEDYHDLTQMLVTLKPQDAADNPAWLLSYDMSGNHYTYSDENTEPQYGTAYYEVAGWKNVFENTHENLYREQAGGAEDE